MVKVKIIVKGRFKYIHAGVGIRLCASINKIKLVSFKKVSPHKIELLAYGYKKDLWKLINWCKGHLSVFVSLNEVSFEFLEQ